MDVSEYNKMAENYRSAMQMTDDLEKKSRKEEALGRIILIMWDQIKNELNAFASCHDDLYYEKVNNYILFQEPLPYLSLTRGCCFHGMTGSRIAKAINIRVVGRYFLRTQAGQEKKD